MCVVYDVICSDDLNLQEKFAIERKHSRSILRLVKRNPVKCCVWQKRTLRKHIFIGGSTKVYSR